MTLSQDEKFFYVSLIAHIFILGVLVLSMNFATPLPVLENTNQNDIISAVILGDSPTSKVLPKQPAIVTPPPKVAVAKPKPVQVPDKEVIALKKADDQKKKLQKKILDDMQQDMFAKDLLADIKQQKKDQLKEAQKQLKKNLQAQVEKSFRQQLLNEDIKLQGTENRQSQGEVNKYKALILQAISEHWIVPTQANKHLSSELKIRLAPGGVVLDVVITKSSGDPSLDRSARAAVLKASPLPVPKEPANFEAFRQFVLKVKPENIVG